ncbi:Leucine aminopeptidase A [Psilocybe cubensis]|uniref:Peptide hydrolase n=2 Tax=Psilocybe cubensis TaxID=181762 RepID=A0A8H8CI79_PSICU|nr:Leucine aminopeptidase A [Psilocybe cubensis]KAH9479432.1 Leucine aminopeptidase A [Psilocybe cubensis]
MHFPVALSLLLSALPLVANAGPIQTAEIKSNVAKGLRLLSLAEGAEPVWKTEDEVFGLLRAGVKFFDVTEVYEEEQKLSSSRVAAKAAALATFPTSVSYKSVLTPILATVSTSNMQSKLSTLSSFNNRYYKASTGASASTWIKDTIADYISTYKRSDVTVSLYAHSYVQSSIIAKIPGTNKAGPVTILGAHMDSINLSNPTSGRAPGADDDGTGTVNLIEAFRVLLAAGFKPTNPVEFHWYAAEEVGLLGSQAIATNYKSSGVNVRAFMQLDMSGYFKPGTTEVMALQADYIDANLNTFLKALITAYSRIPWAMDKPCGYACSDHASWYKAGFPSAFPYEAVTGNDNPNIHKAADTTSVSGFSWAHSLEFAKIAVAFAYELAI